MANNKIEQLSEENKKYAIQIVLESKVGTKQMALDFFNKCLKNKTDNCFLCVSGTEYIGLIGWYQDDGSWAGESLGELFPYGKDIYWVSFFGVREKMRGKGIGTFLMRKLLSVVRKKKARELWTYSGRAKIFYEKMGLVFVTRAIIENEPHDFLKFKFNK